jgi:hypothetical protein
MVYEGRPKYGRSLGPVTSTSACEGWNLAYVSRVGGRFGVMLRASQVVATIRWSAY